MKQLLYILLSLIFIISISSCRKNFEYSPSTGALSFSKDTVYLDTVFSKISSSTYNLKVYNTSNSDITIPTLKLGKGEQSKYRLSVDGIFGKTFTNIPILAKDSLFIFIETTVNINDTGTNALEFLYTDAIEFDAGKNLQKVELATLVKDAVFIFPNRDNTTKIVEKLTIYDNGEPNETEIKGRYLKDDELTFTKDKPYVIYGYAGVGNGKTLTINAGARIHFHSESGLFVGEGGTLKVNGKISTDKKKLENEVIFEGDRLESNFSETPGQWGTIWLSKNSDANVFNYATIKNASIGVYSQGNANSPTNKLTLTNTQIYNSSFYGVLSLNSSVKAENLVINKSGQASFAATFGGRYNLTHCTIANYWNGFSRNLPALLVNNFFVDTESKTTYIADLTEANFNNCIIYGSDNPEFILDELKNDDTAAVFNFKFTNCLVKFEDTKGEFTTPNYDFKDIKKYENVIFNALPNFKNTAKNNLIIGDESAAKGKGNLLFANQVPTDILNTDRTTTPDIGAYQHVKFKK